jgi:hypothetical protein
VKHEYTRCEEDTREQDDRREAETYLPQTGTVIKDLLESKHTM